MNKQLIIFIDREYGSGGHEIGEILSKTFKLPLYDSNLLDEVAKDMHCDLEELKKYDETSKLRIFSRKVRGYSSSPSENVANLQFEELKKMANENRSFIIMGRCAGTVLKDNPGLVSFFVVGDENCKIERTMKRENLSYEEATQLVKKKSIVRKMFNNYYSHAKWSDPRNYDLCINSSSLGIENSAQMLEHFIRKKFNLEVL